MLGTWALLITCVFYHTRQSFLSPSFFQHLTLLLRCHFSPRFKSSSHCSHVPWNPAGFFFLPMVLSSVWFHLQTFYERVSSHSNVFSNGVSAEDATSLWHIEGRLFCFSKLRFCEDTSDYLHVYPGNYFSTFCIKPFFGCLHWSTWSLNCWHPPLLPFTFLTPLPPECLS